MRELSLFSGAGGGLLGTKLLGWRSVGYVEFNDYCQRVLSQRIQDGHLDDAPIFSDVRAFSCIAHEFRGFADVVSAGFPCQPFSVAGKQAGIDDERNMWPATLDIIRAVKPKFCFLENVPGLLSVGDDSAGYMDRYIYTVFRDLAEAGYNARWCVLGADDCGAPHRRKRLWIKGELANSKHARPPASEIRGSDTSRGDSNEAREKTTSQSKGLRKPEELANSNSVRPSGSWWAIDPCYTTEEEYREIDRAFDGSGWGIKSPVCRVANGVANRVDRLRATGNGQVSAVAATAWRILSEA